MDVRENKQHAGTTGNNSEDSVQRENEAEAGVCLGRRR